MTSKRSKLACCVLLLAATGLATLARAREVPAPKTAAEVRGTPPGTVMTKEYVEMVGRLAYIWGWPLVNNLNRALAVSDLPEPGRIGDVVPAAPPGYVSMLTDYIRADERFVTCPNQDTVYGAGYQRLDTKPVIVQVPDFLDRFFTYQITDARTDSFASIGKQYAPSPAFISWSGRTGRATCRRGSTLSFALQPISLRFSRAYSRTTRPRTRPQSSRF